MTNLSAYETLELLTNAIEKRKAYLRNEIQSLGTENTYKRNTKEISRLAMLSELTTISAIINEIKEGKFDLNSVWNIQKLGE